MREAAPIGNWPLITIEDVALDVTVGHVGPMADQYLEAGVPFLRSLSVEPFGIKTEGLKFISPEFHRKLKKSALVPGDVVIVRTGKPGTCAVIPDWLATVNCSDLVIVRCGPRVRPHFLCYIVNSIAGHHIDSHTVGAVQQHFNVGSARTLSFFLPPIEEQDRILMLLRGLDSKIELNRRMNETLEAMARALFRDWFVDFGPTRAKMSGTASYLSDDLWSILPDHLDADGKPEGWEVSTIGDEVRVVGGSTPSTKEPDFWDGGINWATPKDLSNLAAPVLLETSRTITEAGLAKISSGLLPVGAVLLSSRAPIGYLAIAEVPVAINQGFIGMICDKQSSNVFAWLWTLESMEAILAKANGSTFQEISKGNFRPLPVIMPDDAILKAFDALAKPIYQRISQNEKESRTLAQTRDLLLPRLMSGELRIAQARTLEEVA